MMRCAIYCRLSREDEDKLAESESIQNQKSLLLNYAMEQDWEVCQIYADEDYSGADRNRPGFHRMLLDAEEKRFDLILCKTQSRFTRDMELVERYIHGLFPLWGIRFVAIADHIDTSLQGNKKARQINGLVNEWYLEDLSENIRMVLDHKRQQGQYIGGFPLYGYQKHPTEKGKLVIDPEAAAVVRQMFQWAMEGKGKQQIADLLNAQGVPNPSRYKMEHGSGYLNGSMSDPRGLWSRSSVGRILKNEMYLGTMVQGTHRKLSYKSHKLLSVPKEEWFRVEGTHEAIIESEPFFAVQRLHALRSKSDGRGQVHPLSGLVTCLHCGSTMQKNAYSYKGNRHSYLRCPDKRCQSKAEHGCTCSIRLENLLLLVEEQVKLQIQELALPALPQTLELSGVTAPPSPASRERSSLEVRLNKHRAALESLYLDKVSGLVTPQQFCDLSDLLSGELASLRLRQAALEELIAREQTSACQKESLYSQAEALMSHSIPRALLVRLIHKIQIGGKDKHAGSQSIQIHWQF